MSRLRLGLVIAFVVLIALVYSRSTSVYVVTGTVNEYEAAQLISVVSDQTPSGMRISLRGNTVYRGDSDALSLGSHVTVTYKMVAERRPVAAEVRVISATRP